MIFRLETLFCETGGLLQGDALRRSGGFAEMESCTIRGIKWESFAAISTAKKPLCLQSDTRKDISV